MFGQRGVESPEMRTADLVCFRVVHAIDIGGQYLAVINFKSTYYNLYLLSLNENTFVLVVWTSSCELAYTIHGHELARKDT